MGGDGSITKVKGKKNTYLVQISLGFDPVSGKYRRATRVVHGTRTDARKIRDEMRRESERGSAFVASKTTFAEFVEEYLEIREGSGDIGKGALHNLRLHLTLACSYIGQVRLKDITPMMIEGLLLDIKKDKVAEHGTFSNNTLRGYCKDIGMVLRYAVDNDMLVKNPCDKVNLPKKEQTSRKSPTREEAERLVNQLNAAEEAAYARFEALSRECDLRMLSSEESMRRWPMTNFSSLIAARIAMATGMRRSEVLALVWGVVDLDGLTIEVKRANVHCTGIKEPKTRSSARTIAIDSDTAQHLARWKKAQRDVLGTLGFAQDEKTPVCCNNRGKFICPPNFSQWFAGFCACAALPDLKLHELRHFHVSYLVSEKVDWLTIRDRMGHSNTKMIERVYGHAFPENARASAEIIGNVMKANANESRKAED